MPGSLFIVAAPSGSGKSTLVNALLAKEPGISLSISYTSRGPRPGEEDGKHYHFVTREKFEEMAGEGEFFEYAIVHGDLKGTARQSVEPLLASGQDVLLEIDYQGAQRVRAQVPSAVSIFILPPSRLELERRLRTRAKDTEATILRRLADSRKEIAHAWEFDYIVVNEVFDTALAEISTIVRATRLHRRVQQQRLKGLVDSLIA
ncbi:MAG: guanylate kinase [Rhodanobacteraceae bacterium]|nr:guanylate kinase [Rhodanobacteraceae bacterium]MBL0040239.1 guanylate kinase [Xanthomonadales bacterium]